LSLIIIIANLVLLLSYLNKKFIVLSKEEQKETTSDKAKSSVYIFPPSQAANKGDTVKITCLSTTKPKWTASVPDIAWKTLQARNIKFVNNTIVFLRVKRSQSRKYYCEGTDSNGTPFRAASELFVGSKLRLQAMCHPISLPVLKVDNGLFFNHLSALYRKQLDRKYK